MFARFCFVCRWISRKVEIERENVFMLDEAVNDLLPGMKIKVYSHHV